MFEKKFNSIEEVIKFFPDEKTCTEHLKKIRWANGVVSPFDSGSKVYSCTGDKYKCKKTGKYFTVRTSTLFDNTKLSLQLWFIAIYLVKNSPQNISSVRLGRELCITQKTAWLMLKRINNCFNIKNNHEVY